MKKRFEEFKAFALKGNVMDLAVGMMIGGAFGKIVTSLVNDMLMPLISSIFRVRDFTSMKVLLVDKGAEDLNVYLNYGNFIQNVVNFLIIAWCIFVMVKAIERIKPKKVEAPKAPVKSDETKALEEIITLLKKQEETK